MILALLFTTCPTTPRKKLGIKIDQQYPSVVDFLKKDYSIFLYVSMYSTTMTEMVDGYTINSVSVFSGDSEQ